MIEVFIVAFCLLVLYYLALFIYNKANNSHQKKVKERENVNLVAFDEDVSIDIAKNEDDLVQIVDIQKERERIKNRLEVKNVAQVSPDQVKVNEVKEQSKSFNENASEINILKGAYHKQEVLWEQLSAQYIIRITGLESDNQRLKEIETKYYRISHDKQQRIEIDKDSVYQSGISATDLFSDESIAQILASKNNELSNFNF